MSTQRLGLYVVSQFCHPLKSRTYCEMAANLDIAAMRKPYRGRHDTFDVENLVSRDPYDQFSAWFEEACNTDGIKEANAMSLATSSKSGKPSVRMVLLKGFDKTGFKFFTNYESRKGKELAENPQISALFFWEPLMRQVRIDGIVERLSEEESSEYFHSRPRSSQIGACVSHQSQVIESRDVLSNCESELQKKYEDESITIPKPDYWGGYIVRPETIEFWQGQTTRIHDRFVFRKPLDGEVIDPKFTHQGDDGWVFERLSP